MIPSRYLYPVIALVLLWAGSLFGVYQYATAEEDAEEYERYQARLIEDLREQNHQFFESDFMGFEELLQDDSKVAFRPVLTPILQNADLNDLFQRQNSELLKEESKFDYNARKARHRLRQIHRKRAGFALKMIDNQTNFYVENAELLGLRGEEITILAEKHLESHQKLTNVACLNSMPTDFASFSRRVSMLEAELELFHQQLAQEIMYSFSGRAICSSSFYIPSVPVTNSVAQQGRPLLLPIGVVEIDITQDPKNFAIIIDGKSYPFNKDGYAEYPAPTSKRGAHQVEVELQIRNPLTGEVRTSRAPVTYYVE